MSKNTIHNADGIDKSEIRNNEILINILRVLTMLENTLNRSMRNNFYDRSQYPDNFFAIETLILSMRGWINDYNFLSGTETFSYLSTILLNELFGIINDLIDTVNLSKGKKQPSKKQKEIEKKLFRKKMDIFLDKIASEIDSLETYDTDINEQMEKFVQQSFEKYMGKEVKEKENHIVSSRGEKTIVFPCSNLDEYKKIISDRKIFKETVLNNLCSAHQVGHKDSCEGENSFTLAGYRSNNRKVKMKDNLKHDIQIRMGKCKACGVKFSFLPSFLLREKQFCIEIIGSVVRNVLLFNSSIRSAFETLKVFCDKKVKKQYLIG